jgi:hypothetical protein
MKSKVSLQRDLARINKQVRTKEQAMRLCRPGGFQYEEIRNALAILYADLDILRNDLRAITGRRPPPAQGADVPRNFYRDPNQRGYFQ